MSLAPEHKYQDRDLRDDPSLMELAVAYILNYTGEFEPLIEAKEMYEEDGVMPVPVARKVLNCMRHDARVAADLPRPERHSNVVAFEPPRQGRHIKYENKQCNDTEPHYLHHWGKQRQNSCEGVPWPINRGRKSLPVRIKVPYVASRTGTLIHDVNPNGPHVSIWHGPQHAWGYRSDQYSHYKSDADLSVKLMCKLPSYLLNPILIKSDELDKYMEIEDVLLGLRRMSMCPHCAKWRRVG